MADTMKHCKQNARQMHGLFLQYMTCVTQDLFNEQIKNKFKTNRKI